MAEDKKEGEKTFPKKKPTALKRHIQDEKKHLRNRTWKRRIQTARVQFETEKNNEAKVPLLNSLYSLLDKAVKNKVLKKGTASRLKSRFTKKV
ncbi:MAG: 30S ribosomal protein S20 [Chlamydiia bacterium]|nr:30S ribosomal protein S20 [Chlamydiia bacterium]